MNKTKTICESVSVCNSNATLFRTNYYNCPNWFVCILVRTLYTSLGSLYNFKYYFLSIYSIQVKYVNKKHIKQYVYIVWKGHLYKGIYKQTMFTLKGRKINIGFKDQWFWMVMFTSLHHLSRRLLYLELQNHKLLISYLTWIEYIERK
jgi:hypothetical protein